MIKGNLKKFNSYDELTNNLQIGLKFLKETDFATLENGKYQIQGGDIFASVQDYNSKLPEQGKFEAHRKYIDIQYIVKGEEKIGVGNIADFSEITVYDEEKDIVFLSPKKDFENDITLKEGDFAIFYPQDAHKPSIAVTTPEYVKKVVVKVLK